MMRNHFHLVIETPVPNLVDGMHWFQFAIHCGASIVYTPSNTIRFLTQTAASALPETQDHAQGQLLKGQFPADVNEKIVQCLQQKYDD